MVNAHYHWGAKPGQVGRGEIFTLNHWETAWKWESFNKCGKPLETLNHLQLYTAFWPTTHQKWLKPIQHSCFKGFEPNKKNTLAKKYGFPEQLTFLQSSSAGRRPFSEAGADPNHQDDFGETALMETARGLLGIHQIRGNFREYVGNQPNSPVRICMIISCPLELWP